MNFEMKIWDLPKTEKEAIIFFQDKGLLPTTKTVRQWTQHDFILSREGAFLEVYE